MACRDLWICCSRSRHQHDGPQLSQRVLPCTTPHTSSPCPLPQPPLNYWIVDAHHGLIPASSLVPPSHWCTPCWWDGGKNKETINKCLLSCRQLKRRSKSCAHKVKHRIQTPLAVAGRCSATFRRAGLQPWEGKYYHFRCPPLLWFYCRE